MKKRKPVSWFDRVVSALSYLSAGWIGMIVLVVLYFAKKKASRFVQYNVFQSIFISLLFFVVASVFSIVFKVLSLIPLLDYLVAQISMVFNVPIVFGYSILQLFTTVLILYMTVLSACGNYPRVYWISKNVIDRAVR